MMGSPRWRRWETAAQPKLRRRPGEVKKLSSGLRAKVALLKLEGIGVDGTKPTSKVHREVIPLGL